MTDPERIIRQVAENPPTVRITPWQVAGRLLSVLLGIVALVLALMNLAQQSTAASCAAQDARAQYAFTQAVEHLFLPAGATKQQHEQAAQRFHKALDRYASRASDYLNCVS